MNFDKARNDNSADWQSLLFNVSDDHKMALTVKTQKQSITTTVYLMNEQGEFQQISLPLIIN